MLLGACATTNCTFTVYMILHLTPWMSVLKKRPITDKNTCFKEIRRRCIQPIVSTVFMILCEHFTWCRHQSPQMLCREVVLCWARLQDFSPLQPWAVRWQARGWCAGHWRWQKAVFYLNTRAQHLCRGQPEGTSQASKITSQLWIIQGCHICFGYPHLVNLWEDP